MASDSDPPPATPPADGSADFDRLARRYLDLWQSQLAGVAGDPSLTDQIARLFAAANTQIASTLQATQGAPHAPDTASRSAAGTASAAASSRHGPDDVGELRQRVAALEQRIAQLESQLESRLAAR